MTVLDVVLWGHEYIITANHPKRDSGSGIWDVPNHSEMMVVGGREVQVDICCSETDFFL